MNTPAQRLADPWSGCALWHIDLTAPPAKTGLVSLDAQERARAARFAFDVDRLRYQTAHVTMRTLLAQAAGLSDASAVRFAFNPFGKPLLANAPDCHFSLSHSGDVGLLAIDTTRPVGVDVEVRRPLPELDGLARAHFTADECRALREAPSADERLNAFLRIWTRKEAGLKAVGIGLLVDARSMDTGRPGTREDAWLRHPEHGTRRLQLFSGELAPELPFSVAAVQPLAAPRPSPATAPSALEVCG